MRANSEAYVAATEATRLAKYIGTAPRERKSLSPEEQIQLVVLQLMSMPYGASEDRYASAQKQIVIEK